ncbi:MAG: hypothetical protein IT308_03495 [Anaerolineaceae bacterium]|nr:hypothetical protein [Anaerolineaceae bacterium]
MSLKLQKSQHLMRLLPIILLVSVSALAFLPHLQRLGYYRDDWNLIYAGYTQGSLKFIDIYSVDRPLIGYFYAWIFYPLFGNAALGWNISAYLIRLTGILGAYWLLQLLWPSFKKATLAAALLFAIFPGFLEQPNGIQYQPHLLNMTFYIFSLAFTVQALRIQRRAVRFLWTAAAMLLGLTSMAMMEYYIGLEGVRFALIWLMTQPKHRERAALFNRVRSVVIRWAPYATAVLLFLIWRTFIFQSPRAGTDIGTIAKAIFQNPQYEGLRLFAELLKDVVEVAFLSWGVPPYLLLSVARLRDFLTALALGMVAGLAVFFVYRVFSEGGKNSIDQPSEEARPVFAMTSLGGVWVLLTSLPIIFAGREVTFSASLDRFTFPGAMGSALILAGLFFSKERMGLRLWGLIFLTGLAVMTHYINIINYVNQWSTARNVWWQLSWRAPALEENTVLVAHLTGIPLEEDYELWGPANMIYFPTPGPLRVQSEVLYPQSLQNILMGTASERTMRTIDVVRDYANTLVLSQSSLNSCLHVLDGERAELSGIEDYRIQLIAQQSQINRIRVDGEVHRPPADIFGAEPNHAWCYFYQKASLARQRGDWNEVVRLGDEARSQNLRASDWIEWLPFLQGYAYTGAYDAANSILPIIREAPYIHFRVCKVLTAEEEGLPPQYGAGNRYLLQQLCGL